MVKLSILIYESIEIIIRDAYKKILIEWTMSAQPPSARYKQKHFT